jgi:hypothetical protein
MQSGWIDAIYTFVRWRRLSWPRGCRHDCLLPPLVPTPRRHHDCLLASLVATPRHALAQVASHAHTARGRSTWTRIYREREERKRTQLIFLRLGMTGWTIQMQYITDRWCGEYPIALEINYRACKGNYVTLNYGGVAQFTESKVNQFHIFLQLFSHVFLQSDFLSPLTIGINSILIRECMQ